MSSQKGQIQARPHLRHPRIYMMVQQSKRPGMRGGQREAKTPNPNKGKTPAKTPASKAHGKSLLNTPGKSQP
jgi:hypothetical protein